MSTTLTQATPQEKQTHEELLKITKENILKGEVRLRENKAINWSISRPNPRTPHHTPEEEEEEEEELEGTDHLGPPEGPLTSRDN